jgi:alpha-L-fucosidase 2
MPYGPPGAEKLILNIDSLWSGGPFASAEYRGGNPTAPKAEALPAIREQIWQNGTGGMCAGMIYARKRRGKKRETED